MTTAVHIYTSHVAPDVKLEIVARHFTGGEVPPVESVLNADLPWHQIVTHYVHSGCEIVIREVKKEPTP